MTRKEIILDKNIKVIYNKLENIKLNQGYVDLSSSSIQNKNEIIINTSLLNEFSRCLYYL